MGSCPFTSSNEAGRHFAGITPCMTCESLLAVLICGGNGRLKGRPASEYYSSPKQIPTILASLIMEQLGSTVLSLPATSDRGTLTISLFFTAAI